MWTLVKGMAFDTHGRLCFKCGAQASEIHHSSYDIDTLIGKNLEFLHPVCCQCHDGAENDENGKRHFKDANASLDLPTPHVVDDKRKRKALLKGKTTRR